MFNYDSHIGQVFFEKLERCWFKSIKSGIPRKKGGGGGGLEVRENMKICEREWRAYYHFGCL